MSKVIDHPDIIDEAVYVIEQRKKKIAELKEKLSEVQGDDEKEWAISSEISELEAPLRLSIGVFKTPKGYKEYGLRREVETLDLEGNRRIEIDHVELPMGCDVVVGEDNYLEESAGYNVRNIDFQDEDLLCPLAIKVKVEFEL